MPYYAEYVRWLNHLKLTEVRFRSTVTLCRPLLSM